MKIFNLLRQVFLFVTLPGLLLPMPCNPLEMKSRKGIIFHNFFTQYSKINYLTAVFGQPFTGHF